MNKQLLTEQYVWYQKRATRVAAAVVVVLGGLLLKSPMALAALEFCNSTDVTLSTAVASRSSGEWLSKGWHNIKPGKCMDVIPGSLKKRNYYVYAKGDDIRFEGRHTFCTIPDGFRIRGRNCSGKRYDRTKFRKVHTGNTDGFTVSFTRPKVVVLMPSPGVILTPPVGGVILTPSASNGVTLTPSTAHGQPVLLNYPSNLGYAVIRSLN